MDDHPAEDLLVLHHYREGTVDEMTAIEAHLRVCEACAARLRAIGEALALADTDDVPDPGPDFTDRVWRAVAPSLQARRAPGPRPHIILAALAASLALVVVSGALWLRQARPATTARTSDAAPPAQTTPVRGTDPRERVLLTALTDHLSHTEMLLVELMNAPDAPAAATGFEQASADDLVASGRLYRATAEQTGDTQVTSVLDDLESVLVEVARRSNRMPQRDRASLRARIRDDALLFKVRAVSTEIHERQQLWGR